MKWLCCRVRDDGEEKQDLFNAKSSINAIATYDIISTKDWAEKTLNQVSKQYYNPDISLCIQYYPKAETVIGKMMITAHEKIFDNSFFGLDKSSQAMLEYGKIYGQSVLKMYGHSHSFMTIYNASTSFQSRCRS